MKIPVERMLKFRSTFGEVYNEFVPDTYLTHHQLNQLTDYFEDSDRLRSSKLHGVGIVSGLQYWVPRDPSLGHKVIKLTPGVALTTDADLLYFDTLKTYTHYSTFQNLSNYERLLTNNNFSIYQLHTGGVDTAASVDPLSTLPRNINEYHLVLFLDTYKVEKGICSGISCDDTGHIVHMEPKVLLVHKDHWNSTLMPYDTIFQEHNIFDFYQNLPEIYVQRPVLLHSSASSVQGVYDLFHLKTSQWNLLADAYYKIVDRFDSRLDLKSHSIHKDQILTLFKSRFENIDSVYDIQYRFDLFQDLVETYHSIMSLMLFLNVDSNPSYEAFPKHICLGPINHPNWEQARHRMYYSALHKDKHENLKEFKNLIVRFWQQLSTYNIKNTSTIRITSSRDEESRLGRQAIPYYYHFHSLKDNWDWNKRITRTESMNHSYDNPHVNTQLNITHTDKEFYQIHGHLGQNVKTAFNKINQIKKMSGLAFDVKIVSIAEGQSNPNWNDYKCEFQDLNHTLKVWEVDFKCLTKGFEEYFGSIQLGHIASSAGTVSHEGTTRSASRTHTRGTAVLRTGVDDTMTVAELYAEQGPNPSTNTMITAITDPNTAQGVVAVTMRPVIEIYDRFRNHFKFDRSWSEFTQDGAYLDLVRTRIASFCEDQSQFKKALREYMEELSQDSNDDDFFVYGEWFSAFDRLKEVCCYIEKLDWVKQEIQDRKQKILSQLTLSYIVAKNPGAEHRQGVPLGGTLLLVHSGESQGSNPFGLRANQVLADFALPYMCCSDCSPTQIVHIPDADPDPSPTPEPNPTPNPSPDPDPIPIPDPEFKIINQEKTVCELENFTVQVLENDKPISLKGKLELIDTKNSILDYTSGEPILFHSMLTDHSQYPVEAHFTFEHDLEYSIEILPAEEISYQISEKSDKHIIKVDREKLGCKSMEYILKGKTFEIKEDTITLDGKVASTITIQCQDSESCIRPTTLSLPPISSTTVKIDEVRNNRLDTLVLVQNTLASKRPKSNTPWQKVKADIINPKNDFQKEETWRRYASGTKMINLYTETKDLDHKTKSANKIYFSASIFMYFSALRSLNNADFKKTTKPKSNTLYENFIDNISIYDKGTIDVLGKMTFIGSDAQNLRDKYLIYHNKNT